MPPFWVGTGWKMNLTRPQAAGYAATLCASPLLAASDLRLFIIPPFTALATAADALAGTPVLVGAQNMHWADSGAHTGEISADMIVECGAHLVELGHSERRAGAGETDEQIGWKVRRALTAGLRPLVCVGETRLEREAGAAAETVVRQVRLALRDVAAAELRLCLIAYEPVWAIGTAGTPCTPGDAAPVHAAIRAALRGLADGAAIPPILYGGSVGPDNCAALAAEPQIDGLFVGRAAWRPDGLLTIAQTALDARRALGRETR